MADEDGTPTTLDWYVQALGEDVPYSAQSRLDALELVHANIGGSDNPFRVPDRIVERAVLEVGADLYYRKASRNGVVGLEGVEPQTFRINRDPMVAGWPFLRPWLVLGL